MNVEKAATGMLDHLTGRGQQVGGYRLRAAVSVRDRGERGQLVELIVDIGDQRFVFEGREVRPEPEPEPGDQGDGNGEDGGRGEGRREPA